jgi:hypothetical protein
MSFLQRQLWKDVSIILTISSPKEEVQEIASKGGQASHSGGFASMDPDKQVSILLTKLL